MKSKNLIKSFIIEASTKKVFESFVNPNELKRWLTAHSAVVAAFKDGPYALGWDPSAEGDFYCCCGKIRNVIKNKLIHITDMIYYCENSKSIGPVELKFIFNKKGKWTEINFILTFGLKKKFSTENLNALYYSWEEAFYLLKKYLERKSK